MAYLDKDYVFTDVVREELGVSSSRVGQLIRDEKVFPGAQMWDGRWRIPRVELDAYKEQVQNGSGPAKKSESEPKAHVNGQSFFKELDDPEAIVDELLVGLKRLKRILRNRDKEIRGRVAERIIDALKGD